jgi:hypothetical protein
VVLREFEEFTLRSQRGINAKPRLSVHRTGIISMNGPAYDMIGRAPAVVLLFDKKGRTVGLKPAPEGVGHAYPVRKASKGETYAIAAIAFCHYYDIDISVSKSYVPLAEAGDLVFELKTGVEIPKQNRQSPK